MLVPNFQSDAEQVLEIESADGNETADRWGRGGRI